MTGFFFYAGLEPALHSDTSLKLPTGQFIITSPAGWLLTKMIHRIISIRTAPVKVLAGPAIWQPIPAAFLFSPGLKATLQSGSFAKMIHRIIFKRSAQVLGQDLVEICTK
jgi:hypothetical protein